MSRPAGAAPRAFAPLINAHADAIARARAFAGACAVAPAFATAHATVYTGDALTVLRELPSDSVDCIVTSPPYFALRDYGVDGQIGMEATPQEWCARVVEVMREARRVLKPTGTAWVNAGDSYVGGGRGGIGDASTLDGSRRSQNESRKALQLRGPTQAAGLKHKDLIGQPWMLAFALRDDGWYLRQEIIWHKPDAMPESASDRPTRAHECVFLLSKSPRYFYDADAISELAAIQPSPAKRPEGWTVTMRNSRTVWSIPTAGFAGAHFAVYPEELVERCVLAGTSAAGVCPECGKPWVREAKTAGWKPTCGHRVPGGARPRSPVPAVVMDPFLGSGTTAQVAVRLGRRAVGIELSPAYLPLIERRIAAGEMERSRAEDGPLRAEAVTDMGPLWSVDLGTEEFLPPRPPAGAGAARRILRRGGWRAPRSGDAS